MTTQKKTNRKKSPPSTQKNQGIYSLSDGQNGKNRKSKTNTKNRKRPMFLTILVIIFAVFGVGGFFTFRQITKSDEFVIVGEKEIVLTVGEDYHEQGAKVVSFGKDKSGEITIESNVDTSVAGRYYVKYSINDFRFKNVVRYRYVTVEEANV